MLRNNIFRIALHVTYSLYCTEEYYVEDAVRGPRQLRKYCDCCPRRKGQRLQYLVLDEAWCLQILRCYSFLYSLSLLFKWFGVRSSTVNIFWNIVFISFFHAVTSSSRKCVSAATLAVKLFHRRSWEVPDSFHKSPIFYHIFSE